MLISVLVLFTHSRHFGGILNLTRRGLKFDQFSLSFGSYQDIPNVTNWLNMSSSIYFVNLIILQMFNLLSLRTRHLSLFQHSILKTKSYICCSLCFVGQFYHQLYSCHPKNYGHITSPR